MTLKLLLVSNSNELKVTLVESILTKKDYHPLNKHWHSLLLELFDCLERKFYHMIVADWPDCSPLILYRYWFIK